MEWTDWTDETCTGRYEKTWLFTSPLEGQLALKQAISELSGLGLAASLDSLGLQVLSQLLQSED